MLMVSSKGRDMKENKTNAMRILEQHKVEYVVREYENGDVLSGLEIARRLGLDPDMCFKTLVTVNGRDGEHFVFVIPVGCELDLRKAARAAGVKDIEMVKQKELLPLTGYVHGGCSPIGMKKAFRTFFDETAMLFDRIAFSAGKVGMQVEIAFEDLAKVVDYTLADLVRDAI